MPSKDRLKRQKQKLYNQNKKLKADKINNNKSVESSTLNSNKVVNTQVNINQEKLGISNIKNITTLDNNIEKKIPCIVNQNKINTLNTSNTGFANQLIQCNLTNRDLDTIINPQGYLEDVHMDIFFSIVRSVSQFRPQSTAYLQAPERIVAIQQGTKHIQILFSRGCSMGGVGHWVATYYDGIKINVYDSMNSQILHTDSKTYLDKLFPFNPSVEFIRVQQQTNSYDCGLFAIAFCTSIILNKNPENEVFDNSSLRSHVLQMFRSRQITMFPIMRQHQLHENYLKRKINETEEEKNLRINKQKKINKTQIECETSVEKENRLNKLQFNFKKYLSNESLDEKVERLQKLKLNSINYTNNETEEQKAERLVRYSNNHINLIKNESAEEKQIRLKKNLNLLKIKKDTKKKTNENSTTMLARKGLELDVQPHTLGAMNVICCYCSSKNFSFEKPLDGKFTHCCRKGKLNSDVVENFPDFLKNLMTGCDINSKNFKDNIRQYNSALAFASMGASMSPPPGYGPYCFRIHGQIYHESSTALYPPNGKIEKYAQLYIIDSNEALEKRMNVEYNKNCKPEVMKQLDDIIRNINPYSKAYMMLKEVEEREIAKANHNNQAVPDINLWIVSDRTKDKRRYNMPTSNEVAVVFTSNDGEPPINRDISVHPRSGGLVRINQFSENCDPMTYPLLFPRGEQGWNMNTKQADGVKKQTMLQFYMNRLAVRDQFNPCLQAGKLTQQYIVDAYVKVEAERLTYIRLNQPNLRVELYTGLMDHINNIAANEGCKPGNMVILPSTFQGGGRFMQKMYQNAMAIVREFGKPDLFITVTCNPKWPEITEQLREGQTASDRPDIVARVFCGKIKSMLKEFLHDDIFGKVLAYIYVIEFQKRGLPHMHLLLTLDENSKIRNKDDIDQIVSAEIPAENTEPELYHIVRTHMIHGPCGILNKKSPCMFEDKCSKKYPKDFRNETYENINGYPLYKRPNNKAEMFIFWKNGLIKYTIDNRWIVPYNPYLLKKYRTHINVEICSSVKSIKYICDYLCKGHDCASIKLGQADKSKTVQWDEINGFLDARYVSAPECCWRLQEYPLHDKSHVIFELAVHLKHQQAVFFLNGQEKRAVERAATKHTTLTAWFLHNETDANARQYRYMDIPKYYVFNNNAWKARQRETKPPIGRMISVSPKDIERFHLRLILVHATGPKNFEDLRTVDGTLYNTYQEAARALGLLANDKECENCLDEAILSKFPVQLRELFAYLICFHTTTNAKELWEKFKDHLMEDYLLHNSKRISQNKCLRKIAEILAIHRFELKDFSLPEPDDVNDLENENNEIDIQVEKLEGEKNLALCNAEQRKIIELILNAVNNVNNKDRYFFVDGPGGTLKTFIYNTLISILRGQGQKVIAVAWTGIAATLLKRGQTVHSIFKLPVPITDTSVCKIKVNTIAGKLIKNSTAIICDEVTMIPKHALNAIDLFLKDLMNNLLPFGGKVVILGGDFRQCLPIVNYTNHRTAIIEASVLTSHLWPLFKKFSLTQNMRVNKDEQEFCEYLLTVGNGMNDIVTIPSNCISETSLADEIFGTDEIAPNNIYNFTNRAILAPKNDETMKINEIVLNKITGPSKIYYSADSCECDESNKMNYPTEVLNTQLPTGMPPYKLTLKVGAIVMLLRNMNPKRGLCNGTRLIVKDMKTNYLDLEVFTGQSAGTRIYLPRFDLTTDTNLPFTLKRRQFPLRLAFSMTINKSQGQTFDFVGINLEKPVFTHGQLYVAMSRIKTWKNLKIKLTEGSINNESNEGYTKNVVFKEILN